MIVNLFKNKLRTVVDFLDNKKKIKYLPKHEWSDFFIFYNSNKGIYNNEGLENSPDEIKYFFQMCSNSWVFEKFYFFYNKSCIIEPITGWAINKKEEFIPQSIWNNYINNVKPSYFRYKFSIRRKMHIESAIVLSYAWNNYWHFHNDILGQLKIADEMGLPIDIPIVVNAGLKNTKYFQQTLERSPLLSNRNWVFQERDTEIICEEAHLFNSYWANVENFNYVIDAVDFDNQNYFLNRRIFINRKSVRGRNILNMKDVEQILDKYDFEIVECDDMSVGQQANLFAESSHVIGIHGAGLTNIIYRRGFGLSLLEIFSKDFFNPPYFWMCQQYGYDYHSMIAGGSDNPADPNGNFEIDIKELERKIVGMLK